MAEQMKWPIRVGGVYRRKSFPETNRSKVTAIRDGVVYYERWYRGESESWGADYLPMDVFCDLLLPEDQSILTALTMALASALDFMREHCDPTLPLLSEMQDALDLASKGVAR